MVLGAAAMAASDRSLALIQPLGGRRHDGTPPGHHRRIRLAHYEGISAKAWAMGLKPVGVHHKIAAKKIRVRNTKVRERSKSGCAPRWRRAMVGAC
jgi:hypothetical protein